jgi:hypothetical protein
VSQNNFRLTLARHFVSHITRLDHNTPKKKGRKLR